MNNSWTSSCDLSQTTAVLVMLLNKRCGQGSAGISIYQEGGIWTRGSEIALSKSLSLSLHLSVCISVCLPVLLSVCPSNHYRHISQKSRLDLHISIQFLHPYIHHSPSFFLIYLFRLLLPLLLPPLAKVSSRGRLPQPSDQRRVWTDDEIHITACPDLTESKMCDFTPALFSFRSLSGLWLWKDRQQKKLKQTLTYEETSKRTKNYAWRTKEMVDFISLFLGVVR